MESISGQSIDHRITGSLNVKTDERSLNISSGMLSDFSPLHHLSYMYIIFGNIPRQDLRNIAAIQIICRIGVAMAVTSII